jgi:ElaB/YqjD/DUF883 family membrane-anchored ribosome-binding protein
MFPSTAKDDCTNTLKASAHELHDGLHTAANQAGRKVRSIYNSASDEIAHASEQVTTEIRSNPVRSSAIALGIGVLLGALIRR